MSAKFNLFEILHDISVKETEEEEENCTHRHSILIIGLKLQIRILCVIRPVLSGGTAMDQLKQKLNVISYKKKTHTFITLH